MSSFRTWNPASNDEPLPDSEAGSQESGTGKLVHEDVLDNIFYSHLSATDAFNKLLRWSLGAAFIFDTEEELDVRYEKIHERLLYTDFYRAPASSRFHDAEAGGLCRHSVAVAYCLYQLLKSGLWANTCLKPGILCALAHDFCKINQYESFYRNVKNEDTGKWESVAAYRTRDDRDNLLGHGEGSVAVCQKLGIPLNAEMMLAVRWHMGTWDVSQSGMSDLGAACKKYPLVHLIQFADQLSVTTWRDKAENIL